LAAAALVPKTTITSQLYLTL